MNCFDCRAESDTATRATGVCATCGAGICGPHTLVDPIVDEVHSVGNPSTTRRPGRRLHCHTCAPDHVQAKVGKA